MIESNIKIRAYVPIDRSVVRRICSDTAFIGSPVEIFLESRNLFADWATIYYTDYEPESIFLAEYENRVVGYCFGSRNERKYNNIFLIHILPRLLLLSFFVFFADSKARILLFNLAKSFIRGEFRRPDFSNSYPAHLHINVLSEFRNLGIGALLVDKFQDYLKSNSVYALRLATFSPRAKSFFKKAGFKLLYSQKITYFNHILNKDLSLNIYGKNLKSEVENGGIKIN